MARQLSISLLSLLCIGFSFLSAEAQDTDQERIQGVWEIVSMTQSGEAEEDEVGDQARFEGNRIIPDDIEGGGAKISFELDESAMPTLFDMIITIDLGEGPNETMRMLGIYELDGDTLTLCVAGPDSATRPTEFESPRDSDVVLIRFERVVDEE